MLADNYARYFVIIKGSDRIVVIIDTKLNNIWPCGRGLYRINFDRIINILNFNKPAFIKETDKKDSDKSYEK